MDEALRRRIRNSILGAFVADAASLGMHWVYSQRRINELAPAYPEFRAPDEADYEGGVGYFAHAGKRAGDLSQYGEQMLVMLRSLAATDGRYNRAHYTETFRRHFGYGGEFVGYIDRPTRQTLDRIYRDENDAIEMVNAVPYDLFVSKGVRRPPFELPPRRLRRLSSESLASMAGVCPL